MTKVKVTISIDEDVLALVDEMAERQRTNRSACIEAMCRDGAEKRTTFQFRALGRDVKPILEGMLNQWWDPESTGAATTEHEVLFRVSRDDYERWLASVMAKPKKWGK